MANKKITELPAATLPIVTGVKIEAVQGGVNVQVDVSDLPVGSGAVAAIDVSFSPSGTLSSTDVQSALQELDADILAAVAGLKWKNAVRVATVGDATIATAYENGDTVDGVVLATGDRILLKNQTDQTVNGIYTVNASGDPSRSTDADSAVELEGAAVSVLEGTTNANTTWLQTTDNLTLGVSNIVWGQFGSSVPDASASTKGIAKLYTGTGSNTDGAMTQNSATTAFEAKDGDLTAIAGLSPSNDDVLQRKAGAWTNRTLTQLLSDLAALSPPKVLVVACSDEVSPITATTGKITFRMPYAMTLTAVRASLTTAQTSGSIFTVDINDSGTSILSTKLTIDNTEKTSTTAATAAVISDSSLADDAEITVDVDQIGDTTAKGLKIYLLGS
jgi:hypothetical protein